MTIRIANESPVYPGVHVTLVGNGSFLTAVYCSCLVLHVRLISACTSEACASAQHDKSRCCPHAETSNPWVSKLRPVKILISLRIRAG